MGPHQSRRGAEPKRGSKPNCLSTGTCELFGGPLFGEHRRGLFLHRDVRKKRLCWGALSLWLLSLWASREKVTRRRRKLLKPRAAEKQQSKRERERERRDATVSPT